eukprot:COSAG01_NODE_10515_length_2147_cov_1.237305_1_plen_267_part_10
MLHLFTPHDSWQDWVEHHANEIVELLKHEVARNAGSRKSGLPIGIKQRRGGSPDLDPEKFRKPLIDRGKVNNELAQKAGRGLSLLRETQLLAKRVGEIMFARECSRDCQAFLHELRETLTDMVKLVGDIQEQTGTLGDMDRLRDNVTSGMGASNQKTKQATYAWKTNLDTAGDLMSLARGNLEVVNDTIARIGRESEKDHEQDTGNIVNQWRKSLMEFQGGGDPDAPEPEPAPEIEPEPKIEVKIPQWPPHLTFYQVETRRAASYDD